MHFLQRSSKENQHKLTMKLLHFFIALSFGSRLLAQVSFYDESTEEAYILTTESSKAVVEAFMAAHQALDLEFNTSTSAAEYPLRIKNKHQNWVLYSENGQEFIYRDQAKTYSFEFPDERLLPYELLIAERKGKRYVFGLEKKPLPIADIAITEFPSRYPFRVQLRNGTGLLYDADHNVLMDDQDLRGYSFELPDPQLARHYLYIAEHKGKRFLATDIEGMEVFRSIAFDHIQPVMVEKVHRYYDDWQDQLINDTTHVLSYLAIEKDQRWGAACFSSETGRLLQVFGFHYPSLESLPELPDYTDEELEVLHELLTSTSAYAANPVHFGNQNYILLEVSSTESDTPYLHLHCAGQCKTSELPEGNYRVVAHEEDQIIEVWQNDQVGLWNSEVEPVIPCAYDAFALVHLDYMNGCAMNNKGQWQLFDCQTGDLLISSKTASIDELQELWLAR